MKKKKIFKYAGFCFALLLLMVPEVSAQWEEMEVLNYYFSIDTGPRHQWYSKVAHNPINNEFMVVWRTSGKLRDDCEPGDDYECSHSFMSLNARRISPDGQLLADPIELLPPEVGEKLLPVIAHNDLANEYMLAFSMGPDYGEDAVYILRTDDLGTVLYGPEQLLEPMDFAYHADIVFNTVRREYLVVYNDIGVFNAHINNVGFILDENGTQSMGHSRLAIRWGIYTPHVVPIIRLMITISVLGKTSGMCLTGCTRAMLTERCWTMTGI